MTFNLISDAWLPVRRESGAREAICPGELTTNFELDPIVALDFPRPDWNAAVTEWLIGLVFLAFRPAGIEAWSQLFHTPPSHNEMTEAFAFMEFAFGFNGDGPCAYQDFDRLETFERKSVSALLMDAPGQNTIKNNADLFIKRGSADTLSLPNSAAALITLQTYAPAGGAGHRTSLRGGGPLTTLVSPRRKRSTGQAIQALWDKVWANVPDADFDPHAPSRQTPASEAVWARVFPWLALTRTSPSGAIVAPEDVAPSQAFFACPRRIRLVFAPAAGGGEAGGRGPPLAIGLRTVNYGANYQGWIHPLSPYRDDKKAGKLPLHPHAGASDYGDCSAWWGLEGEAALAVRRWDDRRPSVRSILCAEGVEAVGFDMDNMKARQWLEVRLPWVPVYGSNGGNLRELLRQVIQASDEAARAVRYAVTVALFGQRQAAGGYKLPDTLPRDALPETAEQIWRDTDMAFRELVGGFVGVIQDDSGPETIALKQNWRLTLRTAALRIFGDAVDIDGLTDSNPHRLLAASAGLSKALSAFGPVAKALQIAPAKSTQPKKETA